MAEVEAIGRVLRGLALVSREGALTGASHSTNRICAQQYNRALARLIAAGAAPADFFVELTDDSTLDEVVVMASLVADYLKPAGVPEHRMRIRLKDHNLPEPELGHRPRRVREFVRRIVRDEMETDAEAGGTGAEESAERSEADIEELQKYIEAAGDRETTPEERRAAWQAIAALARQRGRALPGAINDRNIHFSYVTGE